MRPDYTERGSGAWGYALGEDQRMHRHVIAGTMIAAGLSAVAAAQPGEQPRRARARLIAEQPVLIPGTTAWLGVSFDIDKDWHLYWNGQSDTGFPIKLTPTLPQGYKLGTVLWPAPTRHLTENFLDHIYENRVTLLLPIEVPASAKIGDKAAFKVEAEWLVCKTVCLPGDAMMTLTLPIAAAPPTAPAGTSLDSKLFAEARANLPKALDPVKPEVRVAWDGDSVRLVAADRSQGMAFYPALDSVPLTDLPTQGKSKSDTLELHAEKARPGDRLVGVVEIGPGERGTRTLFAIDSAWTPVNPGKTGASDTRPPHGG